MKTKYWVLIFLFLANVVLFWKFYLKGLIPFPGNLLVSFYFPWSGGGFAGFDPWTARKDVIAMDVIRQMYPWRDLAFSLIQKGQWPLWNPYNFSGTPLLSNLQSSIFFPGNIVYFLLPRLWTWIGQVIGLPLAMSGFGYMFFRSLKLSRATAVFGGIVISNLSAMVVWAEQTVVVQTIMFLPLILWAINRFTDNHKKFYIWLVSLLLAFSIFGGHIQSGAYVYMITVAYGLYKKIPIKYLFLELLLSFGLAAVQLLPSAELYRESAREGGASQQLFYQSTFPWVNLVTIFAPDFYGNPAVGNFRGMDYGNFQGYFGVVALVMAVYAAIKSFKQQEVRFWLGLSLTGLLFALAPFAYVFDWLRIPILSSGYPSRMIIIFQLGMGILSAYGFERFTSHD